MFDLFVVLSAGLLMDIATASCSFKQFDPSYTFLRLVPGLAPHKEDYQEILSTGTISLQVVNITRRCCLVRCSTYYSQNVRM